MTASLLHSIEAGRLHRLTLDRTVEIVPGPVRPLEPAQIPLRAARGLVLSEAATAGHGLPPLRAMPVIGEPLGSPIGAGRALVGG